MQDRVLTFLNFFVLTFFYYTSSGSRRLPWYDLIPADHWSVCFSYVIKSFLRGGRYHGPGSVRARAPPHVSARGGLPISHCQRVDLEPSARCSLAACWETTYCNATLCTGHIVHALHRWRTCLACKLLSITRHVRTVGGYQAGRAEDSSGWGAGGRGAPPAGCTSTLAGQQEDI